MKKIGLSLLIVFGIILLTGCGKIDFSKTSHIVCSKTANTTSDITTTTMTFSYDKNEKINDFKIETDVNYKKPMSKEGMELTEKTMKLISKIPGLTFESNVGDNNLYYSFSGNIKMLKILMKQIDKNYNEEKIKGDTRIEILEELTTDGYMCEDIKK